MLHRHLTHQQFTLAAIDDIIARGRRSDWAELRMALHQDHTLTAKIQRICDAHIADPFAQRYHF
jgi:hypothetical protein